MGYKDEVINRSSKLREEGAHAVLILSHMGNYCKSDFTNAIRTNETKTDPCEVDEMSLLLDSLPPGTVDGVVQGHRHRISHHYKNGIPVMGTINGGYYMNVLYLTFDS